MPLGHAYRDKDHENNWGGSTVLEAGLSAMGPLGPAYAIDHSPVSL